MKFRALTSFFLFSVLVISVLSMVAHAAEYREVNTEVRAEDILKHIENGDDIYVDNCSIVGELNISKIELETVPNPNFNQLLSQGVEKETILIFTEFRENLSIIEGNITIKNTIIENSLDFSNAQFRNSVEFSETSFCNSTNFVGTYFYNFVNFTDTTFNDYVDFSGTYFNCYANFYRIDFKSSVNFFNAYFSDTADFSVVNFNDFVNFSGVTFNGLAYFYGACFYDNANFSVTTFKDSVDFSGVSFYSIAYFTNSNFNTSANFIGPDSSENVITNGENSEVFTNGYKAESRYTDADNIYYNSRKKSQEIKSFTSFSKWIDILSWITCGYGVRPSHTLYFGGTLIVLFSFIYVKGPSISWGNTSNGIFYFQGPGIVRREEDPKEKDPENQPQKVSFWDALNFSITTFTTVGYGNWYPKENFKKWATLEGLLGYVMLGVFMSTLTTVMIRI